MAGKVHTDFGGDDVASALAIQRGGRIVAAGRKGRAFALARYRQDGQLDRSFGRGGKVVTEFPVERAAEKAAAQHGAAAVAIGEDGKIVAAGGSGSDFALARYLPNGRLDRTFGRGGKVVTDVGARPHQFDLYWLRGANAVAIQLDGKIIAAGSGPRDDFAVVRYTKQGRLDPSFGNGGKVFTNFGPSVASPGSPGGSEDYAEAVALQADGKIIAAGRSDFVFALARYLPDGRLDVSFGKGGRVMTPAGSDDYDVAQAVAIQPDGKILAAGWTGPRFTAVELVRYTPSGRLDPGFGRGGRAIEVGASGANAVTLDNKGRIVLAGDANQRVDPSNGLYAYYVALIRYTPAGWPDPTFGKSGVALTRHRLRHGISARNLLVTAVALQPHAKILVAGGSGRFPRHDFLLERFRSDGSRETGTP